MGLFSGLRDALGIGGGRGGKQGGSKAPRADQRPKPNPKRDYNNQRGADGETNVSRWDKNSRDNFRVVDIDTGKTMNPGKVNTGPARRTPEGEGGGVMPTPPNPDTSKTPPRMLRGIQQKRGGEALGSARMTRKGLGGINRANNKKLGGI